MTAVWSYRLQHLDRLSTDRGILEHAKGTTPRMDCGYCTDDNARMLVVLSREPDEGIAFRLSRLALDFVLAAQNDAGRVHNRFSFDGYWRWTDEAGTEDCWGRAVWGLGVAAATHPHGGVRTVARWAFDRSARQRSPWRRSMAFAALGAADLLVADPGCDVARGLLSDAMFDLIPPEGMSDVWPEGRLAYANGAIAEAVIAGGAALGAPLVVQRGLSMLAWLMDVQTRDGHLSVVGVGGRARDDRSVQFDQQPIEVAALADACWRAWLLTGHRRWLDGVASAAAWFHGANDAGVPMIDETSGGSCDGLQPGGRNANQGAESTLALVSTMQRATCLLPWRAAGIRASGGTSAVSRSGASLAFAARISQARTASWRSVSYSRADPGSN